MILNTFIDKLKKLDNSNDDNKLKNNEILLELYKILKNHSVDKDSIRELNIFKASGTLFKIDDVYLPSNFDDTLKILNIIETNIFEEYISWFKQNGMKEITLEEYFKRLIKICNEDDNIDKKRRIVSYMASEYHHIQNSIEIKDMLKKVKVIECIDGKFYTVFESYANSERLELILGSLKNIAKIENENLKAFYEWIGLESLPRVKDVISKLRCINENGYTNKKQFEEIFNFLGDQFNENKLVDHQIYELSSLKWILTQENNKLYRPNEVFHNKDKNLMTSQAKFIDIDFTKYEKFLNEIKVNTSPKIYLVIEHLKYLIAEKLKVNRDIYRYLNIHISDKSIKELKDYDCINIQDNFYKPSIFFWDEHPFGNYRMRLSDDFRPYKNLFEVLGVKEKYDYNDAIEVIKEISKKYGNNKLDENSKSVLIECMKCLQNEINIDFSSLKDTKCWVNRKDILYKPCELYFDNRKELSSKFHIIENNVIDIPIDILRILEKLGVKKFTDILNVEISDEKIYDECKDTSHSIPIEKIDLIIRILLNNKEKDSNFLECSKDLLKKLKLVKVNDLRVKYKLNFINKVNIVEDYVPAFYRKSDNCLYYDSIEDVYIYIGRELAFAIVQDDSFPNYASNISEIVNPSNDVSKISKNLTLYGFPEYTSNNLNVVETKTISGKLGEDINPNDKCEDNNYQNDVISENNSKTSLVITPDTDKNYHKNLNMNDYNVIDFKNQKQEKTENINHIEDDNEEKTYVSKQDKYDKQKDIQSEFKSKPEFPDKPVNDRNRRGEKIRLDITDRIPKEYSKKAKSERISRNKIDSKTYLKELYTNNENIMVCQICKDEMPFKKINSNEYYFESIDLFKDFGYEIQYNYIALCPLCAAKFKYLFKEINENIQDLKTRIKQGNSLSYPIDLFYEVKNIDFVEKHIFDLKICLEEFDK